MRALVIHDRPEMLAEIVLLIASDGGNACRVDTAADLVTARDLLTQHHYDLAIVDLTIPAAAGMGDTGLQHADWLLHQAFAGTDLKTPADVIAISIDGEAVRGIRNSIGSHVLAVISEDPSGEWRQQLKDKIHYVRSTRRSRLLAANRNYDLDLVILTALDKEMMPYRDLFELSPCEEFKDAQEFSFKSADDNMRRGLILSVGGSGQVPTATMTQAILTQFRPRLAIMTGFCGGVNDKVALGDVAAFRSSSPWDYGKWVEDKSSETPKAKFRPRAEAISLLVNGASRVVRAISTEQEPFAAEALDRAKELSNGAISAPKFKQASAGSGSSVVTSTNILGRIVDLNDNIQVVDMESYGFYHTCRHTPVVAPDYVCIKGVADFCNGEKDDKLHAACSWLSAWTAVDIARRRYDFTSERGNAS